MKDEEVKKVVQSDEDVKIIENGEVMCMEGDSIYVVNVNGKIWNKFYCK